MPAAVNTHINDVPVSKMYKSLNTSSSLFDASSYTVYEPPMANTR
jgi:hypothetical protein